MLAYVALTVAMLLWASSYIALKYVFAIFDPYVVLAARMAICTLCLAPFVWSAWRRIDRQRGDWRWLVFMALCEPCLYFLFESESLLRTSASQAGVLTAMLPVFVAVGARIFLAEHITRSLALGSCVSIAGIAWLTLASEASADAPDPMLGNLLLIVALVCATGYMLVAKRLTRRYPASALTLMQSGMGTLWFGGLMLLPDVQLPTELPLLPSLVVLYLGAGITLGAYGLYTWGVSRIPVSQAGMFLNLIPVFTLMLAWALLGERLNAPQWLACGLILAGVLWGQRPDAPRVQQAAGCSA